MTADKFRELVEQMRRAQIALSKCSKYCDPEAHETRSEAATKLVAEVDDELGILLSERE